MMIDEQAITYLCKKLRIEEEYKRIRDIQSDLYHMRNINDDGVIEKTYNLQIDRDNMKEYVSNKRLKHDNNVRIELLYELIKEIQQLKGKE